MGEKVLLKKYPNRRLYNTETSSYVTLGQVSDLTPWPAPLSYLHEAAASMAAAGTSEAEIQEQSGFGFGLFLWDCMIGRGDSWTVYDPNLRGDPRREVLGKTYYER